MFPGMMGGMGSLALNQLLVVMDGIDNPPFFKRVFTNRINTFLDATYVIPRRFRSCSLRMPTPKPRGDQIYFIGATNVPLEVLDPALIRPGRMGRHVWFRTPTKHDRLDVFDLYITRVAHEADLDTPERRDELARITMGLLARDDRAGLLDGADVRAPRRPRALRLVRHRRGDDDRRVGNGDQHRVHPRGDPGGRDPRGGARRRRARLHEGGGVHPRLDQAARRGARTPHGAREGGAVQLLAQRRGQQPDLDARRDGRGARLLQRELDRRRRRRPERDRAVRVDGRCVRDGAGADRAERRLRERRGARRGPQEDQREARADRVADHEPHRRRRPFAQTRSPA